MQTKTGRVCSLLGAFLLSGCGTYVPDTQDFPGNQGDQQLLVEAVVQSVHCEVSNAISDFYDQAKQYPDMAPMAKVLDNWGVQMVLSLKTEEKGTLNPTVVWTPPSPVTAVFSLSGAATLSADAIRTDKLYFYYKVKDLKNHHCRTGVQPAAPVSSPLIQTNLKFGDWLYDTLIPVGTGQISLPTSPSGPLKQNVIYYEVSFEIVTAGGLSPSWKFKRVTVNPTGTLAAASRDRTHDLQITMGPGDSTGLKGPAATTIIRRYRTLSREWIENAGLTLAISRPERSMPEGRNNQWSKKERARGKKEEPAPDG